MCFKQLYSKEVACQLHFNQPFAEQILFTGFFFATFKHYAVGGWLYEILSWIGKGLMEEEVCIYVSLFIKSARKDFIISVGNLEAAWKPLLVLHVHVCV